MNAQTTMALAVILATTASAQTNQATPAKLRPFQAIVVTISEKPVEKQCEYFIRLSKGLMQRDYAAFTRQSDFPHFGDLAQEIFVQRKFELMRAMLNEDRLEPFNFFTLAEMLAGQQDPATFEILLVRSSPTTPPPKGDEGTKSLEGLVAGEGIPDYSALSLRHYRKSDAFEARARVHLIRILKEHKRTGTRAFAAEALGDFQGPDVNEALEAATKDHGYVPCSQCGEDYVSDYAKCALEKIKTGQ